MNTKAKLLAFKAKQRFTPAGLFPARVATNKRIEVIPIDSSLNSIKGGVGETDDSVMIGIPNDSTAYGRTIRIHEADHLKYSPKDLKGRCYVQAIKDKYPGDEETVTEVRNHIEDAIMGTLAVWLYRPNSVKRDARAAVLMELRNLSRAGVQDWLKDPTVSERVRNKRWISYIGEHFRAMAYLTGTQSAVDSERPIQEIIDKHLFRNLGFSGCQILRAAVCDLFSKQCRNGGGHKGYQAATKSFTQSYLRKYLALLPDLPIQDPGAIRGGKCAPPTANPNGGEQAQGNKGMKPQGRPIDICYRPSEMIMPTNSKRLEPEEFQVQSGYRINGRLLPTIGMGIPVARPFIRRETVVEEAGTVLIDASGSMNVENEELAAVCQSAPAATIAYYSGCNPDGNGSLVVYAKDGRRRDDIVERYGGNDCDLNAVRWLLSQPAPHILVSDIGFCGDSTEAVQEAVRLVKTSPSMHVCNNVADALALFKALNAEANQ